MMIKARVPIFLLSALLLTLDAGNNALAFTFAPSSSSSTSTWSSTWSSTSTTICSSSRTSTRIQMLRDQYINTQSSSSSSIRSQQHQQQQSNKHKHKNKQQSLQLNASNNNSIPPYPIRIAVMGGGNFGLALATVVARQNIPTTLLVRDEEIATTINNTHEHPRYMKDIQLPKNIVATSDPESALSDATYIIHAVPCQYSRSFLDKVKNHVPSHVPVLSASKGIETTSLGFMQDILKECLGEDRSYAFLSGPSFAREICEGVATAVVIASEDLMLAEDLADLMSSENFRVFTSKDVIGVEIGGAVKNVIALAAGMCEGLGLGTNAMSGLVTRGCAEMRRLGLTMGARPSTIAGLSGEYCDVSTEWCEL
jgi:glycerol-3-phosphate dehydrogenase (NAD+)